MYGAVTECPFASLAFWYMGIGLSAQGVNMNRLPGELLWEINENLLQQGDGTCKDSVLTLDSSSCCHKIVLICSIAIVSSPTQAVQRSYDTNITTKQLKR
ncbi:hypothetical protein UY3_16039 [Chelonia mydas]|uniref:Uncharacterized protein n=1 Tax=Chelonia mydas TaxID=8469 RepID=M7AQK6_CHEMY|nr:hypothetical protein UY3_16039 [Chelonia mydas]